MSKIEREAILCLQGPVWGDDELLAGFQHIALHTDKDQHVHVWDPLLVTGLTITPDGATWAQLCASLGSVATVITAAMVDKHWYPLVWRMDDELVMLFTCGVVPAHVEVFEGLAKMVGLRRGVDGTLEQQAGTFCFGGSLWGLGFDFCPTPAVGGRPSPPLSTSWRNKLDSCVGVLQQSWVRCAFDLSWQPLDFPWLTS